MERNLLDYIKTKQCSSKLSFYRLIVPGNHVRTRNPSSAQRMLEPEFSSHWFISEVSMVTLEFSPQ